MTKQALYIWLREQPLGIRDKAVLSKLCHYADDNTYEAGVRVADLAIEVGCCERTIQATLRHLEKLELIVTTGRSKRLRSGGLVPLYRIALELSVEGAKPAPLARASVHPRGRNCAHPLKEGGNILSKERRESRGVKSPVPASIRKQLVDRLDEYFVASYLDRCEWNEADRALRPHSGHAYERIRFEGGRLLKELKITVLKPGA